MRLPTKLIQAARDDDHKVRNGTQRVATAAAEMLHPGRALPCSCNAIAELPEAPRFSEQRYSSRHRIGKCDGLHRL